MKSKALIVLALILLSFVFIKVYDSSVEYPSFIASEDKKGALSIWESLGFDGIRCVKLKYTQTKYNKAVTELGLNGMENYPLHETFQANCKTVEWWDIDLPNEANNFKIIKNGNVRVLTSFKGGYMYYVYEIR